MSGSILVCCENRKKSVPYVQGLELSGVAADRIQVLTPEERPRELELRAAQAAGLVLCGGPDMEPWRYGEEPEPKAELSLLPELDQMELDLLSGASQGRTPVWAICRGMQTVNVFQGGALWQDIGTQIEDAFNHHVPEPLDAMAHPVEVVHSDESFGRLLARAATRVNSRHHQAVKVVGRDLTVVARSPDSLIEVLVLCSSDWWVKGVQWHPEDLLHIEVQRLMWAEFVEVASEKVSRR